jgi:PmbA protein
MLPLVNLRIAVRDGLAYVAQQPDVVESEVFASANTNLTLRLNFTSHIPCNGVEEPKSTDSHGVSVRAAFRTRRGTSIGLGSETSDVSVSGVASALEKARRGAVEDPEFDCLPRPLFDRPTLYEYHDPTLVRLRNSKLLAHGWDVLRKGLDAFQSSEDLLSALERYRAGRPVGEDEAQLADLGLILGGDVVMLLERMAVASTSMPEPQTDESTLIMSFATAMVEEMQAKGTGWSVCTHLTDFDGRAGADAARRAIASMGGQRASSGAYRVVLGPQPVAELLEWILLPGLYLESFHADASPFMRRFGQQIASENLYLYDDGSMPGFAGSKGITDEGLPTGRTDLIRDGHLVGLLSDYFNYRKAMNARRGWGKLGPEPGMVERGILPRNGFRAGNGGGRDFNASVSTVPTNLVIEGREEVTREELLRRVGDGVYIGRIWYTYPVNGFTSGDFSGTVVGDSYLIRDGRLAEPLRPNTLRMNGNILQVINNITGIGQERTGTVRWSSDQVTWAPEIAVSDFPLEAIAGYMEEVF